MISLGQSVLNAIKNIAELNLSNTDIVIKVPSIKVFSFYDPINDKKIQLTWKKTDRSRVHRFPYDYEQILEIEYVQYLNIYKIMILEELCKIKQINLRWVVEDENKTSLQDYEIFIKEEE